VVPTNSWWNKLPKPWVLVNAPAELLQRLTGQRNSYRSFGRVIKAISMADIKICINIALGS
jgi:hypothetical protein